MTTKIPIELSSTPGIVDSSNTTALTLDASQNATFAGTISSGAITSSGVVTATSTSGHRFGRLTLRDDAVEEHQTDTDGAGVTVNYVGYNGGTTRFRSLNIFDGKQQLVGNFSGSDKTLNVVGGYKLNGTTVIDSSRNLTNIGTISSGAITSSGNVTVNGGTLTASSTGGATLTLEDSGSHLFRIVTENNVNSLNFKEGGNNTIMSLEGSNRRVGIGTTSPAKSLSVKAPSGSNGGIDVFHNNGNKVAELVHHGSGDEGRLSLYDGGTNTVQLHGETGQNSYINSGNVGIGTSSPETSLHIKNAGNSFLTLERSGTTGGTGKFGINMEGGSSQQTTMAYDDGGKLVIGRSSDPATQAGFSNDFVLNSSGQVGIGTASPTFALDVQSSGSQVRIRETNTSGYGTLRVQAAGNTHGLEIDCFGTTSGGAYGVGSGGCAIMNVNSTPLAFGVGNSTDMIIDSSGNIGIGTTSPERTLDVNGIIHSQGVVAGGGGQLFMKCSNANSSDDGLFGRIKSLNNGGTTMASIESRSEGTGNNAAHWEFFTNSGSAIANRMRIRSNGTVQVFGALSKGSGSFEIAHPLESKKDTHLLRHSFIEGPQCDNIYRGTIDLVSGTATVDLDAKFTMTNGTFVALNRNVQVFTTNETDWDNVKGSIVGNVLTITCQNNNSTAKVSWLVVGERQDDNIKSSEITNNEGKLILEPEVYEGGT